MTDKLAYCPGCGLEDCACPEDAARPASPEDRFIEAHMEFQNANEWTPSNSENPPARPASEQVADAKRVLSNRVQYGSEARLAWDVLALVARVADLEAQAADAVYAVEQMQKWREACQAAEAQVAALTRAGGGDDYRLRMVSNARERMQEAEDRAEAAEAALATAEDRYQRATEDIGRLMAALANTRQTLELAQQLLPNAGETARQIILRALAGDNTTEPA